MCECLCVMCAYVTYAIVPCEKYTTQWKNSRTELKYNPEDNVCYPATGSVKAAMFPYKTGTIEMLWNGYSPPQPRKTLSLYVCVCVCKKRIRVWVCVFGVCAHVPASKHKPVSPFIPTVLTKQTQQYSTSKRLPFCSPSHPLPPTLSHSLSPSLDLVLISSVSSPAFIVPFSATLVQEREAVMQSLPLSIPCCERE